MDYCLGFDQTFYHSNDDSQAVHVFEAMDRNVGDERRKGIEQQHQSGGGDAGETFPDAYDSRQVSDLFY